MITEAVLTLRIPDEEMTSIDTTELTITLRRHRWINRFLWPADKGASLSRLPGASFVDTQVD